MRTILTALLTVAGVLTIGACVPRPSQVTGVIELPAGATLPPHGSIRIEIYDTTEPDVASPVIGRGGLDIDDVTTPGTFAIDYDPDSIVEGKGYWLLVRIFDEPGDLRFASMFPIEVITRGAPTRDVTVPVVARDR